ncbi:hypothetical protein [Oceanobacillus saliphilus]|uniref:hypothetical protein n=1 Tax=Oceanobacillus saliphilus TaxID=2925834 RepID=UPI00201DE9F0|nr:hypothetical protein [Oceanobacillus saliphilus]
MKRKGFGGIVSILFIVLLLTACSNDENKEPVEEAIHPEEAEEANAAEEESVQPTDEELFDVIEKNLEALLNRDKEKYMDTIHSESPAYELMDETIDQLSGYQLDMQLSDLIVEEKADEQARVFFSQTTMKVEGPEFQNNETSGVYVLRPENGEWKIFHTEETEILALDEDGNVLEDVLDDNVTIEGTYAAIITGLEMPFNGEGWELANYQEAEGEAITEFLPAEQDFSNFTDLLTIHYYEDGGNLIGIDTFISMMESNLAEVTTGNLQFDTLEQSTEQGIFEFSLSGDDVQYDQEEVARVFIKDTDLFAIRYTTLEKTIEDKEEWLEKLNNVK